MLDFIFTHTPLFYLTQSLWRDEAFSILVAERPIMSFIGQLNFEPPIYYILLHFWIKIFGESEIAARSLSLVGFLLATIVVTFWADKLFKKHWLSWFVPIFFFLNPMLLYYAFEIRAYGWYIFFATLSLYAYTTKRYNLLLIANILAFYTHTYAIFLPFIETVHYLAVFGRQKKFFHPMHLAKNLFIRNLIILGIAIGPWLMLLYEETRKLRSTWYYPVDLQLIQSVLGNMFTSYDGTPGGLWPKTAILSFILLVLFAVALTKKTHRHETTFFATMIGMPLAIIIGISFIKPLFVNRYLIFVTISEVMLVAFALSSLKNALIQKLVAGAALALAIGVNIYLPQPKAKLDIRSTILEANLLRESGDILYVSNPLIFFESIYYTKDRHNVFLYNPERNPFPWYIGEMAFSESQMVYGLPEYPARAIIVGMDKSIIMAYRAKPTNTALYTTSGQTTEQP
jgi:uncharacterized membrane protein